VHIGNEAGLSILHTGSVTLFTNHHALQLFNVLHVPLITKNLLSASQLTKDNIVFVEFSHSHCFIKDQATWKTLLHVTLHNGLYELHLPSVASHQILTVSQNTLVVWHSRLGHCSSAVMQLLCKTNYLPISSVDFSFCIDCHKSKSHKLPFVQSTSVATAPLQVIHTDLWGPTPELSFSDHRYYVHFTNEFTRFSWLYTCAYKSDVVPIFHQFK
jgi:GAG-pre-integrase domain